MLLGAHMSISGGLYKAIERGKEAQCEALQIFSKNSNQWKAKPLQKDEIGQFKEKQKSWGEFSILVHDSYLINLGSPKEGDRQKSIHAFLDEIDRCDQLSLPYLVFHPGSHLGAGEEEGCRIIAKSLNDIFEKNPGFQVKLLMETTAGQGTNIGYRFEHLRNILDLLDSREKMGICVDTCHIFAAGYDIRTREGYDRTFQEFDQKIGLEWIKAFHLNDSKKDYLSRVDRHEHIGKGYLGIEAFRFLMNDCRFEKIPMVLETPKGDTDKEDKENLSLLRQLSLESTSKKVVRA
ncbi:MAG: deoxyribonuclease IV [Nitrospirae bacterium]|nr:deoxyribonuclease IV [Nitrospirota bacterium]